MKRKITNNDTTYLESFLDEWGEKYRVEHAQYTKRQILTSWSRFKHLADGTHLEQMTNGKERTLVQRFWDIYMGNRLQNRFGTGSVTSLDEGPDLCLQYKGKKIWIECVCPELMDVDYLKPDDGTMQEGVVNFPHVELLERITGAIRSKKKQYLKYKKDLIKEDDYCFIAVNTALLGPYANIGISGFPSVVDATLAIGSQTITMDKESGKHLSKSIQYRPEMEKKNNKLISLEILDGRQKDYQWLDGVIGGHVHPYAPPELRKLVAVLNNTEKARSLKGILPVKSCYFASWLDEESYNITEWKK